jgi:hypothetical protein
MSTLLQKVRQTVINKMIMNTVPELHHCVLCAAPPSTIISARTQGYQHASGRTTARTRRVAVGPGRARRARQRPCHTSMPKARTTPTVTPIMEDPWRDQYGHMQLARFFEPGDSIQSRDSLQQGSDWKMDRWPSTSMTLLASRLCATRVLLRLWMRKRWAATSKTYRSAFLSGIGGR